MQKIFVLIFFTLSLFARDFTIASYNVENLFDLKKDGTEYKEFIPNTKLQWNKKSFDIKFQNIVNVLREIDADIVALQEIENESLIKLLIQTLPKYKYYTFTKMKNASVGIGFLSKIKIDSNQVIEIDFKPRTYRPILETTFEIENIKFKIFNNHWPSKRAPESYRIKYAKTLYDRILNIPKDYDYVILGDLNSNYDEFKTIKYNKKLNDTSSITGINQVLNTTIKKQFITSDDVLTYDKKRVHYNLWLDLNYHNRFSNIFKGHNSTPDNIIVSPALFDNKKISYIKKSFKVFKPDYLYKNRKIFRWQIKNGIHMARGYSDHLPLIAGFTTNKKSSIILKKDIDVAIDSIANLYNKTKLTKKVTLQDLVVIYKHKKSAIIKDKNSRAIYLYKNAEDLKIGYSYDIDIFQIKDFFGLKEISDYKVLKSNGYIKEYKKYYKDANKIDIFDLNYQNEIITNLNGYYKNGYLYFNNKKIKIYSRKKEDLPKNYSNIRIKSAQLGYYKSNVQIILHSKDDIDVN